jgi:hypothetical protein
MDVKYWEIIADRPSKAGWNQCRAREFSKCVCDAARAERGFWNEWKKGPVSLF